MRFLVDAQLPPALASYLKTLGHEAQHVIELGLAQAPDQAIWRHARDTDLVLISKDEDFAFMHLLDAAGPPVVWVRIGNTTTQNLLHQFDVAFRKIVDAIERGEKLIELTR